MHACARRKTKGIVTARFCSPDSAFELTASNNRLQENRHLDSSKLRAFRFGLFGQYTGMKNPKTKSQRLSPLSGDRQSDKTCDPPADRKPIIRCAATLQGSVPSPEDTVRLLNPQPGSGRQTMQDEAVVVRYGAIAPNTGGNCSIAILPISNLRYRRTTRRAKANRRVRNKSGGAIATGKSRYSQTGDFSSIRHHRHGDRGVAPVRTDSVGIPGYRPAGGRTNPDTGQRT